MLKYAGITLLSASIAVFGLIKSSEIKKALTIRKDVMGLLYAMGNALQFGGKSKEGIFKSFNCRTNELKTFLSSMLDGQNEHESVKVHLCSLTDEDKKLLSDFFTNFGKSTKRESELESLRHFNAEFERIGKQAEKEQLGKILLYRKLGIIIALLAAIIFI